MAEEQKEAKPKKRMTATQAAASIGPLVKEFITGTLQARAEGKQKLAYTFIVCHHEEILRAMDVRPGVDGKFCGDLRREARRGTISSAGRIPRPVSFPVHLCPLRNRF